MPYKRTTEARDFVDALNARTVCAHCGKQPIEWHNPEHVELNRKNFRISSLVARHFPIDKIQAEIARCIPLCRSCHMKEDGRMRNLTPGATVVPPSPCVECGRVFKPLRRGFCGPCDRKRRQALKQQGASA